MIWSVSGGQVASKVSEQLRNKFIKLIFSKRTLWPYQRPPDTECLMDQRETRTIDANVPWSSTWFSSSELNTTNLRCICHDDQSDGSRTVDFAIKEFMLLQPDFSSRML